MANYIGAGGEQAEEDQLLQSFAALTPADDPACPEARELVKQWQAHIARYHDGCDREKLLRMGRLYAADDRFAEMLDSYGDGTAHYIGEAILSFLGQ